MYSILFFKIEIFLKLVRSYKYIWCQFESQSSEFTLYKGVQNFFIYKKLFFGKQFGKLFYNQGESELYSLLNIPLYSLNTSIISTNHCKFSELKPCLS